MKNIHMARKYLNYAGFSMMVFTGMYFIWNAFGSLDGAGICAGVGLLLAVGVVVYLRLQENKAEQALMRRVRAEFSPEDQPQIFEIYFHLKAKELDGLFQNILDKAEGNVREVKKYAGLAESMGWRDFLENRF